MALFTGNIRFTPTDDAQDDNKGNVYYDDSQSQLKQYDGSNWLKVSTSINYDRPGDGQYTADAYTKLLIHSNTSNGIDTLGDSSPGGHTISAQGDVHHKTAQSKIGATSMYFDGTGDYLTIPAHNDWDFESGNFTIDMWVYPGTIDGDIITQWVSGYKAWRLYLNSTNITWECYNSSHSSQLFNFNGTHGMSVNNWYHIALVRNNDNWSIYINGISVASNNQSGACYNSSDNFSIASRNNGQDLYHGYIDECRISKGIARWTSNFTVY